jgi:diguanylate cyclase (GGDEF)-like protein
MNPDQSPAVQDESSRLSQGAVQVRMMRELFTRTRESSVLGFLPVILLAWAHVGAQPLAYLVFWVLGMFFMLTYRFLVAHIFLRQPQLQMDRSRVWFALEWLGATALAATWVSSIPLLGTGEADALFYLRLTFLVGLVAFLLSALGIEMRLYASFMAVIVGGTLLMLALYYPQFLAELPMVGPGLMVYGVMLLVRSRGEHSRTQEWVRARLTQRLLMEQLNRTIRLELETHEALRIKSLELEATNHQLVELATHDGLTGAYRRGHIQAELQRLVKGVQRKPSEMSVMLLDIDFFKLVNDQHGHAVGDDVLKHMTALVQSTLRGNDLFGRWGGEEFIVLMPETGILHALEAAERVRQAVHTLDFSGEDARFGITVSIGVAQLEQDETADQLTQRVDKALYAAKHAGRDCVRTAQGSDVSVFEPV